MGNSGRTDSAVPDPFEAIRRSKKAARSGLFADQPTAQNRSALSCFSAFPGPAREAIQGPVIISP